MHDHKLTGLTNILAELRAVPVPDDLMSELEAAIAGRDIAIGRTASDADKALKIGRRLLPFLDRLVEAWDPSTYDESGSPVRAGIVDGRNDFRELFPKIPLQSEDKMQPASTA